MMALVNYAVTAISHKIRYLTATHRALDQRNVDNTSRLSASAPDNADMLRIDIEKCPETPIGRATRGDG
jgi:hypothetical protein